ALPHVPTVLSFLPLFFLFSLLTWIPTEYCTRTLHCGCEEEKSSSDMGRLILVCLTQLSGSGYKLSCMIQFSQTIQVPSGNFFPVLPRVLLFFSTHGNK
ncbi:hypothetical protein J3F83DRAFT_724176, partial [Trichoderma novae-zelandiae]